MSNRTSVVKTITNLPPGQTSSQAFQANLEPAQDLTFNLGNTNLRWRLGYMGSVVCNNLISDTKITANDGHFATLSVGVLTASSYAGYPTAEQVLKLGSADLPNQVVGGISGTDASNVYPGADRVKVHCNQDFFVDNYVETPFINIMGLGICDQLSVQRVTDASSSTDTDAALSVLGGMSVAKNMATGSLSVTNNAILGGSLSITDTTPTTSPSTGCLVVGGGLASGGAVTVGSNIDIRGTTASTSNTTGCATYAGGVGVTGNVNIGGALKVNSTTASTSTTSGAAIFAGGVGIAGAAYIGGDVKVSSTTASTSSSTGAFVTAGGIGVGGNINTNTLKVNSTADTTALNTGSVQLAGGLSVGKNLYVGGNLNVIGPINNNSGEVIVPDTYTLAMAPANGAVGNMYLFTAQGRGLDVTARVVSSAMGIYLYDSGASYQSHLGVISHSGCTIEAQGDHTILFTNTSNIYQQLKWSFVQIA